MKNQYSGILFVEIMNNPRWLHLKNVKRKLFIILVQYMWNSFISVKLYTTT